VIGCGGPLFVLVPCTSCVQSRQRGVAGTYAVFDRPAICHRAGGSSASKARQSRWEHPARIPTRTGCAARSSSCLVFAGSAQNPVDVIRELGRIQRRPFPAEAEALTADYEGGAAL